ncbi:hypothetical protein HIM_12330 [Hirsutella minnesotensis 3608]|uniref:Uncharacterized protein n=1 Tax=Hirsutella minnesotensis 3608 TaxID=1043627 RepID=A0A0F7ZQQ6_9HYPO|nr:hypothetical protein HIM_12330 [Hirsutella minnesotensis 3608]
MPEQAVRQLVDEVAAKYHGNDNWYLELVAALTVLNRGDLTPLVAQKAVELAGQDRQARRMVWLRLREAMLKLTVVAGQAKALGTQRALQGAIAAEDVPSAQGHRDFNMDRDEALQKCVNYIALMVGDHAAGELNKQLSAEKSLVGHDLGGCLATPPPPRAAASLALVLAAGKLTAVTARMAATYNYCISGTQVLLDDTIMHMRDTERLIVAALVGLDIVWWAEAHVKALLVHKGTPADAREVVDLVHAVANAVDAKLEESARLHDFIHNL